MIRLEEVDIDLVLVTSTTKKVNREDLAL